MMQRAFFVLLAIVMVGCQRAPRAPMVSNPFPVGPVADARLAQDFQMVSTTPDLLTYTLQDVRKGSIQSGQVYQVPISAPAGHDMAFVAGCGSGCTGITARLVMSDGQSQENTKSRGVRAYAYHSVARQPLILMGEVRLTGCQRDACSTYVALYARAR